MAWNADVRARPIEEDPSGRPDAIFDAVIFAVIVDLIDNLAIKAKNPRFDVSFRYQMGDTLTGISRNFEFRFQLALTICGLTIIRIDHYNHTRGGAGRPSTVIMHNARAVVAHPLLQ
jgi:hypothetical protein